MKRIAVLFLALAGGLAAQVPNSDCGEVWVVFFRCVADPSCGAGQKFCTWVFNSEFCGSWDARGCWPGPGNVAAAPPVSPSTLLASVRNPLISVQLPDSAIAWRVRLSLDGKTKYKTVRKPISLDRKVHLNGRLWTVADQTPVYK